MNRYRYDVAIIGGGPAGLAAAAAAREEGAGSVVIIERDYGLGGILGQCIHNGFGLSYFDEELTGPEYADRFVQRARQAGVDVFLDTMVLKIDPERMEVPGVNSKEGNIIFKVKAVVLAMGCRERTRAAIPLPGARPAGIFTAGAAQRFINIQNYIVGKRIVILGSGDIGMIMARRLTLEGCNVEAVVEILPYITGLTRNKVQCLDDYDIPLYLSHTVTDVKGTGRVSSVTVSRVDEGFSPIPGTGWEIDCDTLLLSVGLIPENELSKNCGVLLDPVTGGPVVDNRMQTNIEGIFAAGNVLHVNDLVDNVSLESELAGRSAARFAGNTGQECHGEIAMVPGENVRYVVPQSIKACGDKPVDIYFRASEPAVSVLIEARCGGRVIASRKSPKVNPGEMEHLALDMDGTRAAREIVVSIVSGKTGV